MRAFHALPLAGLVLALAAVGCGKKVYPVNGTVLFEDGKPATELAGGRVSLESVADKSNYASDIQKDGTFRLQDPTGVAGVPPGEYRALVISPDDRRFNPVIDRSYARYDTSGLTVTVGEGATEVPIKLRRLKRGS